jgi:HPt (histidine-containing phosphotransfer) domain-containing protein
MTATPTPVDDVPAQDRAALDRLTRFGGAKLLNEMISLFLAAAPERIAVARAASASGNASGAELALHSLKSSCAQLGAMRMQRLSEEGELSARRGSLDGLPRITEELEHELGRVRHWLTSVRDGGVA